MRLLQKEFNRGAHFVWRRYGGERGSSLGDAIKFMAAVASLHCGNNPGMVGKQSVRPLRDTGRTCETFSRSSYVL